MLDEQDLVERMRRGEQRAFDQFFDATPRALVPSPRVAARSMASKMWHHYDQCVRGLSGFRGGSALFTWLCQICRNHLAYMRRRLARQIPVQTWTHWPRSRRRRRAD